MSASISELLSSLLEFDEINTWTDPITNEIWYEFLTTGFDKNLVEIKSKIYGLLGLPAKPLEVVRVEELEKGLIFSRFKVTMKGKKGWH